MMVRRCTFEAFGLASVRARLAALVVLCEALLRLLLVGIDILLISRFSQSTSFSVPTLVEVCLMMFHLFLAFMKS
jgi:hypothetical protein